MPSKTNHITNLLKEACKASGARWTAWLAPGEPDWLFGPNHGLSKSRQKALAEFLADPKTATWLAGALSSGRRRSRATRTFSRRLGCDRVFIFPNPQAQRLLLVGADRMGKTTLGLFHIVSMSALANTVAEVTLDAEPADIPVWPLEVGLEAYNPQSTLENILSFLSRDLSCDFAYLAIRYGNIFHVQATQNCPTAMIGYDILIQNEGPLAEILASRQGLILENPLQEPLIASGGLREPPIHAWMGLPIIIGQRVIGLAAFASSRSRDFEAATLHKLTRQVGRLAYSVENAIIFSEVARYLQQLALLNELASSASAGVDKDEFARRVMQRLRRVFNTDWAAVLLLSPDGKTLLEHGGGSSIAPPWVIPVDTSLMGSAVETGLPVRIGDLQDASRHFPIHPDLRSELAVPLKYRGKVNGVLVLVSTETNAFSIQDEQLLVVIASHMAGLFENVRLNEETRERAQKLQDSVRQLQALRQTSLDITGDLDLDTLLSRVAQRARDLVGARGAELGLYIEDDHVVQIVVSETPWENVQGVKIPLMADVAGSLAAFGEPIVVADYNAWQGRSLPQEHANFRAVAGVPLKFKGQVIGTLTVLDDRPDKQFVDEDVQLLELLAPQAAISIRNARLYQELGERIKAQQLAESRLVRSARLAAVGEMAAGVAHELNNPLTTVTGFVELVLEELPPDSPQRDDLELVLQEAHRARGVVRRLLDFSRPAEDQRVQADINDLITQVLDLVDHLLRTSGVTIQIDLLEELPWISVDPNQIKQVLLNLVNNALLAMPSGGTLSIQTGVEERDWLGNPKTWLAVTVQDTGEGIPPQNLERIFEPFFSTRPAGKGTGLGLSVSYGIVSSHDGFIEVDSQVGEGSCFTVYLPIERDEAYGYAE